MKWSLLLVLTLAQVLVISVYAEHGARRGHGARPAFLNRDEDYDDKDGSDPDDYDDYDQSPERTSYHRHDGYDQEENQVVNAFEEEDDDEADAEDHPQEDPEDDEHDAEEQDEDDQSEEDLIDQKTPNWNAKRKEYEEHAKKDHLETYAADQKKPQSDKIEVVPRSKWGAEPDKEEFPLELPVQQVWFTYSTDHTAPCRSFKRCARTVLNLQVKCLASGHLTDIPFNFLIGGDGRVYVGRGWKVQPPASYLEPTISGNRLDIAFLGNLTRETMTQKMKQAVRSLVDYGVAHDYISPTYSYKEWDRSGVRSKDTGL